MFTRKKPKDIEDNHVKASTNSFEPKYGLKMPMACYRPPQTTHESHAMPMHESMPTVLEFGHYLTTHPEPLRLAHLFILAKNTIIVAQVQIQ